MDAWIDCMSSLEEEGMTKFFLQKEETLQIEITETENFYSRLPEIIQAVIECTAIVNRRNIERDGKLKLLWFLSKLNLS